MAHGARFLLNRQLSKAWLEWRAAWLEAKQALHTMRSSLGFLINRALSKCWLQWKEAWLEAKQALHTMHSSLGFLINRALSKCWLQWKEAWLEAKQALHTMRSSLGFDQSCLSKCWLQGGAGKRLGKTSNLRQGLSRLLNRDLSRAWCAWVDVVEVRVALLAAARVVFRWQQQAIAYTFQL